MEKINSTIALNYQYQAERKGAKYTIDGTHFFNGGEFCEMVAKDILGYKATKDANTSYDKGSDIPELNASVKSSKATLTTKVIGYDYDSVKKAYFQTVASDKWIWVTTIEDTATLYIMNAEEFGEFMDNWSRYTPDRQTIRFKATSSKMIAWLEDHLN